MATIVLNNAETGATIAFMDGTYITGMITGAASAIATKYLAKENAKTLGIIGAGYQSIFQITAITKVRKIEKILVYDLLEEKIKNLAEILMKENIKIEKATLEDVVKCEIISTITPAREPVIFKNMILPGTHINAVGADAVGKGELDPQILKGAKIVIDNWEQASHSGEINVPLSEGVITKENIYSELGEIVLGNKKGRENETEITVFDSTGLAIQDLFMANYVFKKSGGLGKEVDLM
jgi:alanine dehydrogenase